MRVAGEKTIVILVRSRPPTSIFIILIIFRSHHIEGDHGHHSIRTDRSGISGSEVGSTDTLTIGDRAGEFPGMLKERTFNVVKVSKDKPQPFDAKAKGVTVKYDGKQQSVSIS